ncbi:DUF6056 family protein [Enterobacter sp. ECC-019]|uniref:DUF6056 family protein n=1 Tax=Enterobacter sp. ECC-019 TaxID=3116478 RepID=UPI00375499B8
MQLTNVNKINYILILVAAVAILHLTRSVNLRIDGDDQYFLNLLSTNNIWEILKSRYLTWSGRIGVEFVLLHTIKYSYFWIIAIPVSIFLTCYSITVIASEKNYAALLLSITVFLFSLMKSSVINDAALWVTGFYNYLLPASLAIFTISVCLKPYRYIGISRAIALLAPFIYSYSEQIALAAILALFVVFIFSKKCHKNLSLMCIIISVINFAVCYLSPGSAERAQTEAWFAFPDYLTLNIFQKASLGVYLLHTHLSDFNNTPYLILLAACFVCALVFNKKDPLVIAASCFVALQIIVMFCMNSKNDTNMLKFTPEIFASIKTYAYLLIDLISFFSAIYICFKCFDNSYMVAIALTIGAISVVAMGLSPTVFSSGTRTMFVFDIAVIFSIIWIINFRLHAKKN